MPINMSLALLVVIVQDAGELAFIVAGSAAFES
jgi:hypothetical protein